nr:hypothetical protein [uncultured Carboxylicivirga sp.]
MKIEIVKKTYIELYIYGLYLLTIAFLIKKIIDSGGSNGNLLFVILAILATLRLIPIIPLKRHKNNGQLIVEDELIKIESNRRNISYKISQLENPKIKLRGFDGQAFSKHMEHLHPRHMTEKKVVNGLGSYIKFKHNMNTYKYQLYFDENENYEVLKTFIKTWKEKNPNIELKILR